MPTAFILRRFSLALAVVAAFGGVAEADDAFSRSLLGSWVGPGLDKVQAPSGAQAYVRRGVIFTADREIIRVEAFADEAASVRLFTYESEGPYKLRGPSARIDGAYEADLTNDRSLMTIYVADPSLWRGINLGSCPLEVGKAVEIGRCVSGPPFNTSQCVDQDLIHIDASGALRFGDQNVDRCKARPERLDRAYYVRSPS